mmetsp:Transcript_28413/g.90578  ORF Transcript_28413/g.90578 Transcript_28413/m.90578 type:complete len:285 (+) Transcript_28413:1027-1881(+)
MPRAGGRWAASDGGEGLGVIGDRVAAGGVTNCIATGWTAMPCRAHKPIIPNSALTCASLAIAAAGKRPRVTRLRPSRCSCVERLRFVEEHLAFRVLCGLPLPAARRPNLGRNGRDGARSALPAVSRLELAAQDGIALPWVSKQVQVGGTPHRRKDAPPAARALLLVVHLAHRPARRPLTRSGGRAYRSSRTAGQPSPGSAGQRPRPTRAAAGRVGGLPLPYRGRLSPRESFEPGGPLELLSCAVCGAVVRPHPDQREQVGQHARLDLEIQWRVGRQRRGQVHLE